MARGGTGTGAAGFGAGLLLLVATGLSACGDDSVGRAGADIAAGAPAPGGAGAPTSSPAGSAGSTVPPATSTTTRAATAPPPTTAGVGSTAPPTTAAAPTSTTPTTAPRQPECQPAGFAFTVTTDKAVYVVGETILFTPSAVNRGAPCSYGPYHRWHYSTSVDGRATGNSWIGGFSFDGGTVATGGKVVYSFGPAAYVEGVGMNTWVWSTDSFGTARVTFEIRPA